MTTPCRRKTLTHIDADTEADAKKLLPKIDSKNARSKLEKRHKPYWVNVANGISLGYRRNEGSGTWSVRAADGKGGNWVKIFAVTDDKEEADNINVLDFEQASAKARQLARGGGPGAGAGRPVNVDEALHDYAEDLRANGGGPTNATQPRYHLTDVLLSKTVSLLTVRELSKWRNSLLAKGLKAASVNRLNKGLKAALNLAAEHDDRITNAKAWTKGLAALPEDEDVEDEDIVAVEDKILTDQQLRNIVTSAYNISTEFGLYVEVHVATGARSSQIGRLNVGDLLTGAAPSLRMPASRKGGRKRKTRIKKPMPISASLTKRLLRAVAGRGTNQPLLLNSDGTRWKNSNDHRRLFIKAVQAAGLPAATTLYHARHTAITRKLLAGAPTRLVASSFDTSVAMIEKTYSKFIADHGDALMRVAMFDADAPLANNVVALTR